MTFGEAIPNGFRKYATFEGRASRSEFWWWVLFVFLASLVAGFMGDIVSAVVGLGLLVPNIAVTARRLHDIDRSGWWQLVGLIPLVGWLILIYWCVQGPVEPNRFSGAQAVA
jgi:uncharacterized membrane protein YhaH (DUF805 family)